MTQVQLVDRWGYAAAGLAVVLLGAGCAAQGETVADAEVADDARGAFTVAEVEAVEEFLADDPRGPTTEDIDESLLIDGEVVQNPRQWTVGAPGYVSALLVEVEEAFS
ncbi:hypothetical protein [Nocardiopsis tropica]|uniref:Uncharacterized protein n=1 Tax=Nocardiopsis tropica TaxID=109330 RepID=A0ABU7KK49_9ACTN|nr:hypothetical protein [Nocardiopsis umidischolae]MEE2049379.1 hypothetical protein [Nocardiopsis umidischolae]